MMTTMMMLTVPNTMHHRVRRQTRHLVTAFHLNIRRRHHVDDPRSAATRVAIIVMVIVIIIIIRVTIHLHGSEFGPPLLITECAAGPHPTVSERHFVETYIHIIWFRCSLYKMNVDLQYR